MSPLGSAVPVALMVGGASLADLRAAVATAPPDLTVHLDESSTAVRLLVSRGFGSPHGGARGVADLRVSEDPGAGLRVSGRVRPGRLNRIVTVPFAALATLFVGLGLLLTITDPDALGLVVVGALFGGGAWTVRSIERPYVDRVLADVTHPDGWLLEALATASRERHGQ